MASQPSSQFTAKGVEWTSYRFDWSMWSWTDIADNACGITSNVLKYFPTGIDRRLEGPLVYHMRNAREQYARFKFCNYMVVLHLDGKRYGLERFEWMLIAKSPIDVIGEMTQMTSHPSYESMMMVLNTMIRMKTWG